jgi:hypothetical protein
MTVFLYSEGIGGYLDAISESGPGVSRLAGGEHHPRAVQQVDVLVQADLLHRLGDTRGVPHLCHSGALQAIDQGALAHVGQTHDACKATNKTSCNPAERGPLTAVATVGVFPVTTCIPWSLGNRDHTNLWTMLHAGCRYE